MARATQTLPSTPAEISISTTPMTTFAQRPPLQQLDNPHMMSERGNGRRTSARLAGNDKTIENYDLSLEPVKGNQNVAASKQSKGNPHSTIAKTGAKRKAGQYTCCTVCVTYDARKTLQIKALVLCVSAN